MTEDQNTPEWVQRVAARITGSPEPERAEDTAVRPAWARAVADRMAGREAAPEDVREAREAVRPEPGRFERAVLARLGHGGQTTNNQ